MALKENETSVEKLSEMKAQALLQKDNEAVAQQPEEEILIPPRQLEAQFVYFYDLKVRILPHDPEDEEWTSDVKSFNIRTISASELSMFYFSDSFLSRWVRIHFHGGASDQFPKSPIKSFLSAIGGTFELPEVPKVEGRQISSYNWLECTLFENGILAVTIRVKNTEPIADKTYLESIARPEYLRSHHIDSKSGDLVMAVDQLLEDIEPEIANFLNSLEMRVIHIDGDAERSVHVMYSPMEHPGGSGAKRKFKAKQFLAKSEDPEEVQLIYPGQTMDPLSKDATGRWRSSSDAPVLHLLQRSRPYIGTIVDFTEAIGNQHCILGPLLTKPDRGDWRVALTGEGEVLRTRVHKFAVAAARTTPKFIENFINLEQYWTENPRRDIYHPGPSIVFIGRRGWTCIKLEDRDQLAFHLGVVETVLFSIQATLASFRATRRFVEQVKRRGDEVSIALNKKLAKDDFTTTSDDIPSHIHKFTNFLARARLHAPVDDMSILLRSYLMTHTGILAMRRIRDLLHYDVQMENARHTIESYAASLQQANQYWTSRNAQFSRNSLQNQEKTLSNQTESLGNQTRALRYQTVSILLTMITLLIGLLNQTKNSYLQIAAIIVAVFVFLLGLRYAYKGRPYKLS
jgi:hypothetical protein